MSVRGTLRRQAIAAELEGLQVICAQLMRDNAELRDRLEILSQASRRTASAPAPAPGHVISRRGVMTKALGAAAVTVVGGAALANRGALPASASNGASVTAGAETTSEARTSVRYDGAPNFGGVVLLGNDSTYGGQSANYPAALGGFAGAGATVGKGGVANGIYGFTDNGAGNGIVGYNSGAVAGIGAGVLGLAFGAKNTAVQGHNTAGTAVSGTTDGTSAEATAVLGVINSTAPGAFSSAVRGQNNGTSGLGIGVWGSHAGSGWGVYATSVSGIGLSASGGTGTGVSASGATALAANGTTVGVSSSGATAVTANGSTLGVAASGPTAVTATGGTVGVSASGPTALDATGTTVGVTASGPIGINATGAVTGITTSGPTAMVATGTSIGLSANAPTAISVTGTGPLGRAIVAGATSKAPTVHVSNDGTGPALRATTGPGSGAPGTGCLVGDSHEATGVLGLSEGGDGVRGDSKAGRGGNFSGGAAQIKLAPGAGASHPVMGQAGDLYCDRGGRLWFCKLGGAKAVWKQLA
jgi:hypothetical protein